MTTDLGGFSHCIRNSIQVHIAAGDSGIQEFLQAKHRAEETNGTERFSRSDGDVGPT